MYLADNYTQKFKFISNKNNTRYELTAKYTYEFNVIYNAFIYAFEIYEESKENEDSFSLILRVMENQTDLKVVDLHPDRNKYYLGKGISISLILKCREVFGKRIISSNNLKKSEYCEWNSPEAIEKVWNPLVLLGLAIYLENDDQYIVF
ncbi:hypothetical protein BBI01_03655 [Chryseobacterium artocarpi]|uniref:Uncharacterized protein n=1 Tax=Chryseobacterium artocarpi TaxID=1414727 RepID=A0A1B9A139_9FLAO|nr:hypothetical protein [Chryseobacterium artocarpi]OCA77555.1 hypothetical protein BBI01_03655 [Chryseobacterium artocarpi]